MKSLPATAAIARDALDVIRRHRLLIAVVFCLLMAPSMLIISRIPPKYQATASVLIVNGWHGGAALSSPDLPSIVGSTDVLERAQRELGISTPLIEMKSHLVAKPPAYGSGIMRIQYTDSDREVAAVVVNGIADALVRYNSALSTARYDNDLRELDGELSKQKRRLENIDAQLKAQGDESLSTGEADDKAGGSSASDVSALKSERAIANANLQGDIAHVRAAATDARSGILLADPLYQQLQASLTKASAELADARTRYTAQNPALSALQERVDSLRAAAIQEAARALSSANPVTGTASSDEFKAEASVEADRAKVTAIDEELADETKDLNLAGKLELLRLARDQALHEYQSIATRRATSLADRADAMALGSIEVVDRAIPSEAVSGVPRTRLTLTVALVMAMIAFASAFLADQLRPSLRRATQIEELYGKPLIATLRASHRDTK